MRDRLDHDYTRVNCSLEWNMIKIKFTIDSI